MGDYMDYQVIINPELGGTETGKSYNGESEKEYNLRFSKLLSNKLKEMGINNTLIRTSDKDMNDIERLNMIKRLINNNSNSIIISNGLGSDDIEIIYGLNRTDNLASRLATNLEDNEFTVSKYYQRRDSTNTNLDYDYIIRNLPNNESIIIRYGDITSDNNYLNGRIEDLVNVVANTLKSYLGLANDYYIVKSGDNLYSIARKFNTTVDEIKKLNNLTSNSLSLGQRLIIKSIPSTITDTNTYYIVKKGDSLYSVALKYNMTANELKELNNLTSNILSVGQKLRVNKDIPTGSNTYKVVAGDNLYSIANKYNTTVDELKKLNNLTSNNLSIGQVLIIESGTTINNNTYKVVNGDTLYSIARKYNITVDELKKLNNLTSNNLSIGQILKVPNSNNIEYVVKKGDNLYSIANKYGVSVKDIMNLNNLKNTNLSINQKLIIPNK